MSDNVNADNQDHDTTEAEYVPPVEASAGIEPEDTISESDLYAQLASDKGTYKECHQGEVRSCYNDQDLRGLARMDKMLRSLRDMECPAFTVSANHRTKAMQVRSSDWLQSFCLSLLRMFDVYDPRYGYSEYLLSLFQYARRFNFIDAEGRLNAGLATILRYPTVEAVPFCNEFLNALARHYRSREFGQRLVERARQSRRISNSLDTLIDTFLQQHSRLCVVRVDLEYCRNGQDDNLGPAISDMSPRAFRLDGVLHDRDRFLNGLRDCGLKKNLLGYAWRLEFGGQRGDHIHFIAFFIGRQHRNHGYLGTQIGEYWQRTAGQGAVYHNCNANWRQYKKLGIGQIDRKDERAVQNLHYAASYLAKADQLLRVNPEIACRTFGCSQIKWPKDKAPPATTDLDERYTGKFIRDKEVSKRNPVQVNARRYVSTHGLPEPKGRKCKGKVADGL
jgi:hypothetical protein